MSHIEWTLLILYLCTGVFVGATAYVDDESMPASVAAGILWLPILLGNMTVKGRNE